MSADPWSSTGKARARVRAGVEYFIAVDGYYSNGAGTFSLDLTFEEGPDNDAFESARDLGAGPKASATGDTTRATREANDPSVFDWSYGAATVWYSWTAPASGGVEIETSGSTFDTVLGVFTGGRMDALTRIASNDNASSSTRTSNVRFRAEAGVTYRIAVDGRNSGDAGAVNLSLVSSPPPVNDLLGQATTLPGNRSASIVGTTFGGSAELGRRPTFSTRMLRARSGTRGPRQVEAR